MKKKQLRKMAIERQKDLLVDDKKKIERAITENLLRTDLWTNSHVIGVTVSMPLEWDTTLLMEAAWKQKKIICVPKSIKEGRKLKFYQLNTLDELEQSSYGILEPVEAASELVEKNDIDLLIVPGLLFDKKGYRIGFGGGYYDRFLEGFQKTTVSLCSEQQLVDQLPSEEHDIPVQNIVTENGLLTI